MKILAPVLLFISFSANAQLKKGDWSIGTSTNIPGNFKYRNNGSDLKSTEFRFNPSFGYFITDRLEAGGGPVFNYTRVRHNNILNNNLVSKNRASAYGLNLYTRYYLKKEGRFVPYLTAFAEYLYTSGVSYDNNGNKSSYFDNGLNIGAGAGASWFIAPRTALFSEITWSRQFSDLNGRSHGLNLNLGFQFYFGGKKKK